MNNLEKAVPILQVSNLSKSYPIESGLFRTRGSVDAALGVSFSIYPGQTIALVGESGSGKSTVAKMIQGLTAPAGGEIFLNGRDAALLSRKERAHVVQMIFQDPFASLNPKMSVGSMLREAFRQSKKQESGEKNARQEIETLLQSVGLPGNILRDYPHQFSGGQRQRLGIARALAMKPSLIIADEPVSALDLSIQAQILNLLADIKESSGISYLLIAHDLAVVEHMADRVLVMQAGKIVEEGSVKNIFTTPKEPYTKTLLAAMPSIPVE